MKQQWRQRGLRSQRVSEAPRVEAAITPPQPQFFIRDDRKVVYENVAQVLAMVQRSGVLKRGFMTQPGG